MNNADDKAAVAVASYLQSRAALSGAVPARTAVLPWQISRYVGGDPDLDVPTLKQALRQDLALYRLYRDLLATRASGVSPRQATAQSHQASPRRTGEGFVLEFRTSRANAGQVYVTLVLEHEREDGAIVQLHVLAADDLLRLEFPPLVGKHSQRLFSSDSAELALLRRSDSEVVLVLP